MTEAKKLAKKPAKKFIGSDVVLTVTDKEGDEIEVTADAFSSVDFTGTTVKGIAYYTAKAKQLGAK